MNPWERDEIDMWNEEMKEQYEEYLDNMQDLEVMSFEEFKEIKMEELGSYWDGCDESDFEENIG